MGHLSKALATVRTGCLALALSVGFTGPAYAQLDIGHSGAGIIGGEQFAEIFVPVRDASACEYEEYWYLYENYPSPYPGSRNPIQIVITPTPKTEIPDYAKSLKSFRQHMKQKHPNGYMIVVTAKEMRPECRQG